MQRFILKYPEATNVLDEFFEIKRIIDENGSPDKIFYHVGETHSFRCFGVDLMTGEFLVDAMPLHPTDNEGHLLTNRNVDYRPVWFRRWYKTLEVGFGSNNEPKQTNTYWALFLGWQFTDRGKNYKRTIQIRKDGTVGMG